MVSLFQDGHYDLSYVIWPDIHEDNVKTFVGEWAEALFAEYTSYAHEPFALRIGEYLPLYEQYEWLVELQSTNPETREPNLNLAPSQIMISGRQKYFCRSYEFPGDHYGGRVDIDVVMPERSQDRRPRPEASLLLRLAFSHYYERNDEYYPGRTDYLDAPKIEIRNLGRCPTIDDIWQ